MNQHDIPSQNQLLFPLLASVQENGGQATTTEIYQRVAEKVELSAATRAATTTLESSGTINLWERQVRWVQQRAKLLGYLDRQDDRGWSLTEKGVNTLENIRPGALLTVYENADGIALWAEAEATVQYIENELIQAIITSPPYPLLRKKDYENQRPEEEHIQWLVNFFQEAREKLTPNGSLVLNLGPAWQPGQPTQSLYTEKLLIQLCEHAGYFLAQKFYWHNVSKLPSPAEWVTVRRVRVTPAIEEIFWLGRCPYPKANNRNVLRPYSDSMRQRIAQGGETGKSRPSGHHLKQGAFATDNGGSIPHNLIVVPNSSSNDTYQRYCRENQLPVHPARFPAELPEFFIKLVTDPEDIIWDPFAGSLQVASCAQRLGRRWISNEKSRVYLRGGIGGRFGSDELPADKHENGPIFA